MERKEPVASKEEQAARILTSEGAPTIDLGSHGTAHAILSEKTMLSFVDMPASSYADPHRHEGIEQTTILLDGSADFVVEGKVYPVSKGEILVFAPNEEHGAYVGPNGARVLDVFAPPRPDLVEKLKSAQA